MICSAVRGSRGRRSQTDSTVAVAEHVHGRLIEAMTQQGGSDFATGLDSTGRSQKAGVRDPHAAPGLEEDEDRPLAVRSFGHVGQRRKDRRVLRQADAETVQLSQVSQARLTRPHARKR